MLSGCIAFSHRSGHNAAIRVLYIAVYLSILAPLLVNSAITLSYCAGDVRSHSICKVETGSVCLHVPPTQLLLTLNHIVWVCEATAQLCCYAHDRGLRCAGSDHSQRSY